MAGDAEKPGSDPIYFSPFDGLMDLFNLVLVWCSHDGPNVLDITCYSLIYLSCQSKIYYSVGLFVFLFIYIYICLSVTIDFQTSTNSVGHNCIAISLKLNMLTHERNSFRHRKL